MSVPAGYAAPNPAVNCTINYAASVATVLGKLNQIVTATVIQTGEGAGGDQGNSVYATPAEAQQLGADPAVDKLYLQFKIEGVEGYQEAATIGHQLAQGNVAALTELFSALYPYGSPAQQAVNAALAIPSVATALKAELTAAVKA
jgi:hypothetical protein